MSAGVTITEGQIMLAAVVGFIAIFAAFAPAIGVAMNHWSKSKQEHTDASIFTFLLWLIGLQFLVSVGFFAVLSLFDVLIKVDGLSILGVDGALALFWKIPVIGNTAMAQAWTTIIVMVRETLKMVNAFLPVVIVFSGISAGYFISEKQTSTRGDHGGNIDYFGYGLRMFAAAFISSVAYVGWSDLAAYALQMPGNSAGEIATLHDAASAWWREGLKVSTTTTQSSSILK